MKHVITLPLLCALSGCGAVRIAEAPPRQVLLQLHAAPGLNQGSQGQPLALVARIYKLRQLAGFQSASFDAIVNGADLGQDMAEVREITLVPGQRYEAVEKLGRDVAYVGVAGLFRVPGQWRLVFTAKDAEQAGIRVGLFGCGMSAGGGARPVPAAWSTVNCQ